MRRISRGKPKKSESTSDAEEEINSSLKVDNDETGSNNDTEASTAGKKRNARGRVKANEDDHDESKEDAEGQENGKPPSKKKKKDNDESIEESDKESEKSSGKKKDEIEENGKSNAKNKKKTKSAQKQEEDHDDGEEYEVEKIIDQRTIKGRRQFLVRWKGYGEESDTWEQEKELNCDRLIEEFLTEQEENNESFEQKDESKDKTEKKPKAKKEDKKAKKSKKSHKAKNDKNEENGDEDDEVDEKEYEVEKIVEVHFRKDKSREFLIRWKGFSSNSDTWEPEEHLNCPELINKFMEKLEKIKNSDSRELRLNPGHTKRFTLTMHADKRQSRRNANKERVTYHECDA